ncbi:MAG: Cof-type HAD-IIB family hydrolase [Proteobacteria bacterium]|nr:Cof-type HAD-IIB family hydrolase [Pseudomonadota bacterium]
MNTSLLDKEKYKLIVFDLDGTLLTQEFALLQPTVEAIRDIRDSGLRVSVATGRSYKSAKPFLDRLEIIEPMVFSNGSVFDNPDTGEREIISGIPLETALIVLMLLPEFRISLKMHLSDGTIFKSDNTPWPDEGEHFEIGEIKPNLKEELDQDPIKIVFYDVDGQMDDFERRLGQVLGAKSQVRLFRSHVRYVEMTNKDISKGKAVKKLISKLSIQPEEVIAVGDQDNDYEMIRDFGLGILAGPGTPKLLEVCRHQIPMPEHNGIEELRDWLLNSKGIGS